MSWLGTRSLSAKKTPRQRKVQKLQLEKLEDRRVMAADPLPVLMVLADRQDFYFQEYNDTRIALEAEGLDVVVAATTTNATTPHPGSGQGWDSGVVVPDIALANVDADDYSAIVFVGGWGASMYQYAYNDPNSDGIIDNYYANDAYNGDPDLNDGQIAEQKNIVNNLIGEFIAEGKHVAALCHGVTVLAWARVDGVSPIMGRHVAVPTTVSAPDQFYNGQWRNGGYMLGQYDQVIDNGGIASPVSGSIGDPNTVADDVVVDGKIITAENFNSALQFGHVIGQQVLASLPEDPPVVVQPPVAMVGSDLVVQGTADADTIYIWSGAEAETVYVWLNGQQSGPFVIPAGGHIRVFAGDGNDQVFATDLRVSASIFGEGGHDLITGGSANDLLDGGEGVDRLWASQGDDLIRGGAGDDFLFGREGNDILLGGDGNDHLEGFEGADILIGGGGSDGMCGGDGDDLLIGGSTSYDNEDAALLSLLLYWTSPGPIAAKIGWLSSDLAATRLKHGETVFDDGSPDVLGGNAGVDWIFANLSDTAYPDAGDQFGT